MYSRGMTKEWREIFLENFVKIFMCDYKVFPMEWLKSTDFFTAPASTRFHGAYEGGLFDHCVNVADVLHHLSKQIAPPMLRRWGRQESPIIIGLLHDVTKLGLYKKDPEENKWVHSPEWQGSWVHGEDSVVKLKSRIQLTEEEEYCIRWHMGAYETSSWSGYDEAIRKYPNVLWTHTADMYASKLLENRK